MRAKPVSISISEDILIRAKQRQEALGEKSFSAYAEKVLRQDLNAALNETAHQYKTNSEKDQPSAEVVGKHLVDRAVADARDLPTPPNAGAKPATYRTRRRSKKPPTA